MGLQGRIALWWGSHFPWLGTRQFSRAGYFSICPFKPAYHQGSWRKSLGRRVSVGGVEYRWQVWYRKGTWRERRRNRRRCRSMCRGGCSSSHLCYLWDKKWDYLLGVKEAQVGGRLKRSANNLERLWRRIGGVTDGRQVISLKTSEWGPPWSWAAHPAAASMEGCMTMVAEQPVGQIWGLGLVRLIPRWG